MAPHDAFPTRGEDEWVAIAAPDDAAFAALAGVMGRPDLARDPDFATLAARKANEDRLTGIIADWTRPGDKHEIAGRLQAAGVAAAPVQNARDLFADPLLRHRGLPQRVTHPLAGTHDYQGLPYHISGLNLRIRKPAPGFGQHNAEVLTGLGLSRDEIATLDRDDVIADWPHRPGTPPVKKVKALG
jgi:crotonobetainyl-CoA:carnitine CoA-transferase CaiB-like acyl-CoA transferase